MSDADILRQARKDFGRCEDHERENRKDAKDDLDFARLSKQWPAAIVAQRQRESRPCLTINKCAPVIRQVVNDARQNRPAITVRPVDSQADPETADIMTGLIRNIEQSSDADTAYDTAVDNAASCGFGYFRINLDYANDIDVETALSGNLGAEMFEKDIRFERIVNPFSVYGDPDSTAADSSDWNVCFVIDDVSRADFKRKYPNATVTDFDAADWGGATSDWLTEDKVRVAEYWTRERSEQSVLAVANDAGEVQVLRIEDFQKRQRELAAAGFAQIAPPRTIPSYKVTQRIITAAEVLETNEWPGRFIPIVPVYGDEVYADGKRYLRSLIRDAKDPNRMFNYWRTMATELIALAPRAPWVAPKGSFETDRVKWDTANTSSYSTLEYDDKGQPPQRTPFAGIPAGALQEAINAADDIKAVTGIYDASLGAPSNETSGRAIVARQREGDISSFHFIDNLSRAIRHAGRIIIDLIPKVYSTPRVVRILGEDGTPDAKVINKPVAEESEGEKIERIYDLRVGRYDLVVVAGPSFTTRREEAASQMIDLIRSYPDAAPIIGDLLAKNLDWPGADEIAKRLEKMLPPQVRDEDGGIPPELQQQMQEMAQTIQTLGRQLQDMKSDRAIDFAKAENDRRKTGIEEYRAETDRMTALTPAMGPAEIQALVIQTLQQLLSGQELPETEGQGRPTGTMPEPESLAA